MLLLLDLGADTILQLELLTAANPFFSNIRQIVKPSKRIAAKVVVPWTHQNVFGQGWVSIKAFSNKVRDEIGLDEYIRNWIIRILKLDSCKKELDRSS